MSDASDSTAIPPGLEGPVPRDGFSEPQPWIETYRHAFKMETVHLFHKYLCHVFPFIGEVLESFMF